MSGAEAHRKIIEANAAYENFQTACAAFQVALARKDRVLQEAERQNALAALEVYFDSLMAAQLIAHQAEPKK